MKKNEISWTNGGKRIVGLFLILFSVVGVILFNIEGWKNDIFFYLLGGWGLGMLI